MDEETIYVDLDDKITASLFGKRFWNTSKILGLEMQHEYALFGVDKWRLKMVVKGHPDDIKMFSDFVNEAVELLEEELLLL